MSSEVFDPVFALAEKTYPGATAHGAAATVSRELILMALGWEALEAARNSARRMAYLDAMVIARSGLGRALIEVGQKLEAAGIVAESERKSMLEEATNVENGQ